MTRIKTLSAIAAGLVLAIAVTGCSGDSSNSTGNVSAGSAVRTINLSQSAAKISELKSFRFSLAASIDAGTQSPATVEDALGDAMAAMLLSGLKDVKVEGAVVAPDKLQISVKMSGQEFGFVQIGDEAWTMFGGMWTPIAPEDLGLENGFDFGDLTADALPVEVVEAAKVTKEKVNGADATRYSFDKAAIQKLADDASADQQLDDANLDVWLTDEGVPLRMTMKFAGKDDAGQKTSMQMEFNLKDVNENITIKAPM